MSKQSEFILEKVGKGGYFVDLGASDGVCGSNTLELEQNGWEGLCIDALPRNYAALIHNRKCYCVEAVVAAKSGPVDFLFQSRGAGKAAFGGSGMPEFMPPNHVDFVTHHLGGRKRTVNAVPLVALLNTYFCPSRINFLDIDVEGAAYEVIKLFPFGQWHIDFINVEAKGDSLKNIELLLRPYGYEAVESFGGMDVMFQRVCLQRKKKSWQVLFDSIFQKKTV
jgi:FkbM family methyltransferase